MDFENIFKSYKARKLIVSDIPNILELYSGNSEYFLHCPPSPSRETIQDDMSALPLGKKANDKYYIGLFEGDSIIAVMDLIDRYPDDETAFIGLLMVAKSLQGHGVGTFIVNALTEALKAKHYKRIRLGYIKTNRSAQRFWLKQGFHPTESESARKYYTVIEAEKTL